MERTQASSPQEGESAAGAVEREAGVTLDPAVVVVGDGGPPPPPPKHKLIKEQRNLARRRDGEPSGQPERTEERRTEKEGDEETSAPVLGRHVVEVDIEINVVQEDNVRESEKTPTPPPIKPGSKRKSTTPQRRRRKPDADDAPAADRPPPHVGAVAGSVHQRAALISAPSQVSVMSETAAEELCDLRNYYSNQLRRINYISHEYLERRRESSSEPGVLACIREPLRSLRLPRGQTIAQTARSLWTRVSGRRKLIHR